MKERCFGSGNASAFREQLILKLEQVTNMASSTSNSTDGITIWEIDPLHSSVQFSVRHMMVSNVRGEFKLLSGSVRLDENNPANTTVDASIDARSVNTREPDRDKHLKSNDFLDTVHYPEISYVSKKVERAPQGRFTVIGDLTIHGTTKEVILAVEPLSAAVKDPWGNLRRGTSATARLNRQEFGLRWNQVLETGGVLVGNELSVSIDVELIEKEPESPVVPDESVVQVAG